MKILMAGVPGGGWASGEERLESLWRDRRLWNFYYWKVERERETMIKKKVDLFLDSGAFSAYTKGVVIDIHDYIAFIKEHLEFLEVYANLDVIGNPEATLKNQQIMEKAGLKPLPCFHYGEPIKFLKYYMDRYDYLALGGMAADANGYPLPNAVRSAWLDQIFSLHICDPKTGLPRVKVHGFGMTSLKLMIRYPWYSVDSTSWVVASRMGQIFVPRWKDGAYCYDEHTHKIQVSSRSPDVKSKGDHISTLNPHLREYVLEYFRVKGFKLGKSEFREEGASYELKEDELWFGKKGDSPRMVERIIERGLCNDYSLRDQIDVMYFLDLEKSLPPWPRPFRQSVGGFGL